VLLTRVPPRTARTVMAMARIWASAMCSFARRDRAAFEFHPGPKGLPPG
jgi:hypothetical protein